ncbi:hypothetical protein HMPREF0063_11075 [Aeromicrobium marinum DSM 15272]|uniref:Uncharacterized protein n=1 Tax=Aeromicrobium marinum DSM 15272 TaxID=585531 RepID=E2SAL7_9ACTN|nr:hypothetical protein [Aeromicrobium marinum]EFQ83413.1 hypothetical protein HMPREF0063_11075 [Aeromicrobium marinum DSM 15272]
MSDDGRPGDPEPDDHPRDESARVRSQFDAIVEGLELESPTFPESEPEPPRREPVRPDVPEELRDVDDLPDEPFYREVPPVELKPRDLPTTLSWCGVLGAPALLVLCTMLRIWLPRSMVVGAGLIFVAGAIYLISQLPSHGPGRRDGPDDGAVL